MALQGLFSSSNHESKDPDERLAAVKDLTDIAILCKLAKEDSSSRVRLAAVEKITDQELLSDIALNGNEIDARIAAVEKIDSQEELARIIKIRKNFQLMGACFTKITDRDLLERIAHDKEYNMSARRMAIENFANEAYLSEIEEKKSRTDPPTSPEEVDELIDKYGAENLARALGRFRGSKSAIVALGEIIRRGGDAGETALEYVAKGLTYSNKEVADAAHEELAKIEDGVLIAKLISLMDNSRLRDKILEVLKKIDHPDARQIVESADE